MPSGGVAELPGMVAFAESMQAHPRFSAAPGSAASTLLGTLRTLCSVYKLLHAAQPEARHTALAVRGAWLTIPARLPVVLPLGGLTRVCGDWVSLGSGFRPYCPLCPRGYPILRCHVGGVTERGSVGVDQRQRRPAAEGSTGGLTCWRCLDFAVHPTNSTGGHAAVARRLSSGGTSWRLEDGGDSRLGLA